MLETHLYRTVLCETANCTMLTRLGHYFCEGMLPVLLPLPSFCNCGHKDTVVLQGNQIMEFTVLLQAAEEKIKHLSQTSSWFREQWCIQEKCLEVFAVENARQLERVSALIRKVEDMKIREADLVATNELLQGVQEPSLTLSIGQTNVGKGPQYPGLQRGHHPHSRSLGYPARKSAALINPSPQKHSQLFCEGLER